VFLRPWQACLLGLYEPWPERQWHSARRAPQKLFVLTCVCPARACPPSPILGSGFFRGSSACRGIRCSAEVPPLCGELRHLTVEMP